jgi:hypothetical protein
MVAAGVLVALAGIALHRAIAALRGRLVLDLDEHERHV